MFWNSKNITIRTLIRSAMVYIPFGNFTKSLQFTDSYEVRLLRFTLSPASAYYNSRTHTECDIVLRILGTMDSVLQFPYSYKVRLESSIEPRKMRYYNSCTHIKCDSIDKHIDSSSIISYESAKLYFTTKINRNNIILPNDYLIFTLSF